MRASGGHSSPSEPTPNLRVVRDLLGDLEKLLKRFHTHRGTEWAREGAGLSDNSLSLWNEAKEAVQQAEQVYRTVKARLADVDANPVRARDLLAMDVATPGGPAPSVTALRRAIQAVQRALGKADLIGESRTDWDETEVVRNEAMDVGATELASRAEALKRQIFSDPFSKRGPELKALKHEVFESRKTQLRGYLDALKAKASRLGRREDPKGVALNQAADAHLWREPVDLDAAERAIAEWAAFLDEPPAGGRR